MKYSVDRIENGIAVCEDFNGNRINIEVGFLPEKVKEGDMLDVADGKFIILKDEADVRRKKLAELQKSIFTK